MELDDCIDELDYLSFDDCECGYSPFQKKPLDRFVLTDSDRQRINHPLKYTFHCLSNLDNQIQCQYFEMLKIGNYCTYKNESVDS